MEYVPAIDAPEKRVIIVGVKKRKSGISVIGALPWGSHISLFYGSKQDLIDTLGPYFKAGLENNEFCFLVISNQITKREAEEAIAREVVNFPRYLETGQIEILPYTEVYLENGVFNKQKVLDIIAEKIDQTHSYGYDGIRIHGDEFWLDKATWDNFINYEKEVNTAIGNSNTLALCAYPLDNCGANEFVDVMNNHQYAFIVDEGEWFSLRKNTAAEMKQQPATDASSTLTPLQSKFAVSGLKNFTDEEIIELLMSLCPHGEHGHLLSKLIKTFKNVRGLLAASTEELTKAGLDSLCIAYIQILREIPAEVLKEKIEEKPVFDSAQEIFDYLYYSMRDLDNEVLKVIHLNSQSQIIDVVDLFEGDSNNIAINSREVVESAIEHDARSLIFVHNHPSGDPTPSKNDIRLTRDLVFMGNILQIRVLDHIVIGDNKYYSFAAEGLIEEFEMDFLNLRLRGAPKQTQK
jgi:DNA repair protein RadC